MKICKVVIENYQQFKHLELDFTHPETGEPLEQICFIGSNGTGKSTLLDLLHGFARETTFNFKPLILALELDFNGKRYIFGRVTGKAFFRTKESWDSQLLKNSSDNVFRVPYTVLPDIESGTEAVFSKAPQNGDSLTIKVEAESDINTYKQIKDVPSGILNVLDMMKLLNKG